ncbi:MAG: serine/threonine-protein kinase [Kofleriaceae bacterium]
MTTLRIAGSRCVLGEVIGRGGMGDVYAVDHPELGAMAVKVLLPELRREPLLVLRMQEEAAAASRILHTNVVRIVDHGVTSDGVPFVAMFRVAGKPLGLAIAEHGPLPLAQLRSAAGQILAGLAEIHVAGFVHGDLKSDNILWDAEERRAVIIDFGLARAPSTRLRDEHDMISGTPDYMAPELVCGDAITRAADIYAVGVILYEMLTGSTPFGGGTVAQILARQLHDDVVPPSLRCPDRAIPRELESAIMRALAKNPHLRPTQAMRLRAQVMRATSAPPKELPSCTRGVFTTNGPTRRWTRAHAVQNDRAWKQHEPLIAGATRRSR